jgi:hypothetical protein
LASGPYSIAIELCNLSLKVGVLPVGRSLMSLRMGKVFGSPETNKEEVRV